MDEPVFWFLPQAFLIEILHLLFALAGFSVNIITLYYSIGDLRFQKEWTDNESIFRVFMANRNVREELSRLVLNVIFVAIGVVSIINPPPSGISISQELTFQLRFTRWALSIGSMFLTYKSVKDLTDRHTLHGMMRRNRKVVN